MNLAKHRNVQYCKLDKLSQHIRSNNYDRHVQVMVNGEPKFFEVIKTKKSITDKVPIATAFFILGNAKLTVLEFIADMLICVDPRSYRLLYMGIIIFCRISYYSNLDTDSLMFAMCDEFDHMIQAGKESEWLKIKEKWFCKNQDCKIPGKLKIGMTLILKVLSTLNSEKETKSGSFVGLSPKTYLLGDYKSYKRYKSTRTEYMY